MDQIYWLALAGFATLLTFCWMFVPRRLFVTTGIGGASWSTLALTGGGIEKVLRDGTRVAAPAPELQYVAVGMAVLSFLALLLYYFDYYPPSGETDAAGHNPRRN